MGTVVVSDWTCSDVAQWLRANGFVNYEDLFTVKHRIDGKALLTLTESDLKTDLEITVLGDVKRLMILIRDLQTENETFYNHMGNGVSKTRGGSRKVRPRYKRHHSSLSTSSADDFDFSFGHMSTYLDPDFTKLVFSFVYCSCVFLLTSFAMVIVHDRVPDKEKYPPLPDLILDNLPLIPWAFSLCEATGLLLLSIWIVILVFHRHRFILMRRMFALTGTVFLLRCITMLITSLSVPAVHLQCEKKVYGDISTRIQHALEITRGFGMTLQGVRTCGDYMFSGHTVIITMLNFLITEYTPRRVYMLHTATWVMNLFGIFFILASHEHYSIDVFIAFYITSRLFLYYHSLANNRALTQMDHFRTRVWFPLFSFFEAKCDGIVPNEYEWPLPWPKPNANGGHGRVRNGKRK